MTALIVLAGILPVLFILVSFIYIFIVFPIRVMMHCASLKELPGSTKAVWIIVMLLTWYLGALLFSFLADPTKRFRPNAVRIAIFLICMVVIKFGIQAAGIDLNKLRSERRAARTAAAQPVSPPPAAPAIASAPIAAAQVKAEPEIELTLKNGEKVKGVVIESGVTYQKIRTADGSTRLITTFEIADPS